MTSELENRCKRVRSASTAEAAKALIAELPDPPHRRASPAHDVQSIPLKPNCEGRGVGFCGGIRIPYQYADATLSDT